MRAALIVEREVLSDAGPRIADAVIGMQIDLLVLDRLPQPLNEYVEAVDLALFRAGSLVRLLLQAVK